MDYAIYKTNDGKQPRPVHVFKQEDHNHRAKDAVRKKLNDMWLRALQRPICKNASGNKDAFEYDYMTSVDTKERIRFYIAKHKLI